MSLGSRPAASMIPVTPAEATMKLASTTFEAAMKRARRRSGASACRTAFKGVT